MLLFPDPTTAQMDPFTAVPTLVLICDVKDPLTGQPYGRDPRYVAKKAEAYVKSTGIADTIYIGPELEFFIFDDVRFDQGYNFGFYHLDVGEPATGTAAAWAPPTTRTSATGARQKQGYFPVSPADHHQDLRSEMVLEPRERGGQDRGPPPRGRLGRSDRDRHALRHPGEDGGPGALVQVLSPRTRPRSTARP